MAFFNQAHISDFISNIDDHGIATIPNFLKSETTRALLKELGLYNMKVAEKEKGPYKVKQSYRFVASFNENGMFLAVRNELENLLNIQFEEKFRAYLSEPLEFSDLVVQSYEPCATILRGGGRYQKADLWWHQRDAPGIRSTYQFFATRYF